MANKTRVNGFDLIMMNNGFANNVVVQVLDRTHKSVAEFRSECERGYSQEHAWRDAIRWASESRERQL